MPFGRLWRTGANEPTTLRLAGPVTIAGVAVDAPKVSIYTVPGPETWEIIVNRSTSQWGLESEYVPAIAAQEIGRSVVPSQTGQPPVEQLTFEFESGPEPGQTELVLRWETTVVRIPVRPAQGTPNRSPRPQNPKRPGV